VLLVTVGRTMNLLWMVCVNPIPIYVPVCSLSTHEPVYPSIQT